MPELCGVRFVKVFRAQRGSIRGGGTRRELLLQYRFPGLSETGRHLETRINDGALYEDYHKQNHYGAKV